MYGVTRLVAVEHRCGCRTKHDRDQAIGLPTSPRTSCPVQGVKARPSLLRWTPWWKNVHSIKRPRTAQQTQSLPKRERSVASSCQHPDDGPGMILSFHRDGVSPDIVFLHGNNRTWQGERRLIGDVWRGRTWGTFRKTWP